MDVPYEYLRIRSNNIFASSLWKGVCAASRRRLLSFPHDGLGDGVTGAVVGLMVGLGDAVVGGGVWVGEEA